MLIHNRFQKIFISLAFSFILGACSTTIFDEDMDSMSNMPNSMIDQTQNLPQEKEQSEEIEDKPVTLVPTEHYSAKQQAELAMALKKAAQEAEAEKKAAAIEQEKKEKLENQRIQKLCTENNYLKNSSISQLYQSFLKQGNACTSVSNVNVVKHLVTVISNNYDSQEIRILNADKGFLSLFGNAIAQSARAEKVMLNKKILDYGCHLLKPNACSMIKKSLY